MGISENSRTRTPKYSNRLKFVNFSDREKQEADEKHQPQSTKSEPGGRSSNHTGTQEQ